MTPGKTWDLAWNHEQDLCPDCTVLYKKGKSSNTHLHFFRLIPLTADSVTDFLLALCQVISAPSATSAMKTAKNLHR